MLSDIELNILRDQRNASLNNLVDPKTLEAFNNKIELTSEWKTFRQALLDLTNQDVESLSDIIWPDSPYAIEEQKTK